MARVGEPAGDDREAGRGRGAPPHPARRTAAAATRARADRCKEDTKLDSVRRRRRTPPRRDGALIVGDVRGERQPPRPGEATHSVVVRVEDARAHCEQAREHGARILQEPTDFDYGERQYSAEDPAGHQWTFSETLADVAPEEWGGISVARD
ncbi:MAG: VOC family protein [Solirubrobacteraceae bacterium]